MPCIFDWTLFSLLCRFVTCLFIGSLLTSSAQAVFYDRSDYFDNKVLYDEASDIIDVLYDQQMTEHDKEVRLIFLNKKLVPVMQALKVENEKRFVETLKLEHGLSDDEIDGILQDRWVIDGFKITMENDFIAGTDRFYTNGIAVEISFNNPEFEKFFKKLGFDHNDFFVLCGQEMYTPSQRSARTRLPDEPPHAGVLHCGTAVNSYKMDQQKSRLRSMQRFEMQLGVIGKSAHAREVQNAFHKLIDDKPVNWDLQTGDRFIVNVNFQKYIKVAEGDLYGDSEPEYSLVINAGGNVGNYTNFLNAGVMLNYRLLGSLIDLYVGNHITPSFAEQLAMMSLENRMKQMVCRRKWSLNMYFGIDTRYVFNNYRLDGNNLHFSDVQPIVFDLKGGAVLRYDSFFFDIGITRRSSEWVNTRGHSDGPPHTFGSVNITKRFRDFDDLGASILHPIRWLTDYEYRKEISERKRISKMARKDGVKITVDTNDPKNPQKTYDIKCD